MSAEEDIITRVYEDFQNTPELQTALTAHNRSTLHQFRQYLREIENIYRRLYERQQPRQKESRFSSRLQHSETSKPNRFVEKSRNFENLKLNRFSESSRPDDNSKPQYSSSKDRSTAEKTLNTDPPYPCRHCQAKGLKANHWMINCPLRGDSKFKKEKGFADKEEDANLSEEEAGESDYRRQQRGYMARHVVVDESSDSDSHSEDGAEDILASFDVACRDCKASFPSGNKLHDHLNAFNAHAVEGTPSIIDLTAQPKGEYPEGISNCTETRVRAFRTVDPEPSEPFVAVLDSGFGRSAVNRKLLASLPHTIKVIKSLVIRGIGGRQAVTEVATFVFYLRSTQGVFLKLRIAALIFDDLDADLLIGTDYIHAWNMVLDIPRQLAVFHRSNKTGKPIAMVSLQVTRQPSSKVVIRAAKDCIIAANSVGQVPLRFSHSGRADLVFSSGLSEIPDGVISAAQTTLTYSNQISAPQKIKRGAILGTASTVNGGTFAYAAQATKVLNGFLGLDTAQKQASKPDIRWLKEEYRPQYRYELPEGVMIPDIATSTYREIHVNEKLPLSQQEQLRKLAKRFAVLFNDTPGMARQSEEEWLRIKVAPELERDLKPRPPYRNAPRAKQAIDETFDENVRLGRMAQAKHSPYSLPVFVVYKYTPEGAVKKARPVVDLRPLNNIAETDAYPLPLQEEILSSLAFADWISSVDFVSSFYQHFLHPESQYRTATASHRGLELFRVAPMSFKNSPAHNQRTFERLFVGLL